MDFFEHQQQARTRTWWLLAYLMLAILAVILAMNAVVFVIAYAWDGFSSSSYLYYGSALSAWLALPYWIYLTCGTLIVIMAGSIWRALELREGGIAVAEMLDAVPIPANSNINSHRRLRNVAEEMSIAAGVSTPRLYLLESETSINAFVAGIRSTDTVMVVTQGMLNQLGRQELQGVIGHEFSHLLNGDTKLNVRLIVLLAGIQNIGQLGGFMLRSIHYGSGRHRAGIAELGLVIAGTMLAVIGSIGLFFARIIKAAISRQREYLADASAVQFTRSKSGIANALHKIRQHNASSWLVNAHAEELSHMCVSEPVRHYFTSWMSTHPTINARIKRIDPYFEIKNKRETPLDKPGVGMFESAIGFAAGEAESVGISGEGIAASVGNPAPSHYDYALALKAKLPEEILGDIHSADGARHLVYALLLSGERDQIKTSLELITVREDASAANATLKYRKALRGMWQRARLPLLDLSVPALRELDEHQQQEFFETLHSLVNLDARVTLFEYLLLVVLAQHLERPGSKVSGHMINSYGKVTAELALLFSILTEVGGGSTVRRETLYARTMKSFSSKPPARPSRGKFTTRAIDDALHAVSRLAPLLKRPVIQACADCIIEDGRVKIAEAELLRLISEGIDCPMPPLLPDELRTAEAAANSPPRYIAYSR